MNSKDRLRGKRTAGRILFALSASGIILLTMVGYGKSGANNMASHTPIDLIVGEKGEQFIRRNPSIAAVDRQPAGLNFYSLRWTVKEMGSVIVKNGAVRLPIANVISVTATEDMDFQDEGLSELSIHSAPATTDKIGHDEARLATFAFLQQIQQLGWKVTIPRDMARIRGKHMNNFRLATGKYTTLDATYVPTLVEWMEYENLTTWEFYLDHVFLSVQIMRESTLTDPSKPGVYMLITTLQNEQEHFRGYIDGLKRPRWKALLKAELAELEKIRWTKESELRLKGVPIDENYVDPPLPDLTMKGGFKYQAQHWVN